MIKNNLLKNILAIVFGVLIAIIIAEILLMIFFPQHLITDKRFSTEFNENYGWYNVPDFYHEQRSVDTGKKIFFKHNSKGLRSDVEHDYESSAKRMAVLGDSYVYGSQLDQEETFPYYLQSLSDYEILNFGVPAWGPDQSYLFLQDEVIKYSPDVVIFMLFQNDFSDAFFIETPGSYRKPGFELVDGKLNLMNYPVSEIEKKEDKKSMVKQIDGHLSSKMNLYYLFRHNLYGVIGDIFKKKVEYSETYHDSVEVSLQKEYNQNMRYSMILVCELLAKMGEFAKDNDMEFVVINVPSAIQADLDIRKSTFDRYSDVSIDDFDFTKPNRLVQGCTQMNEVAYFDLLPAFSQESDLFIKADLHWNAAGSEFAADLVHDFLVENGLVE